MEKFRLLDGLGVEIALDVAASDAFHIIRLLDGLDTLRNHGRSQPLGHLHDRADDGAAASADLATQEAHIQLDDVHIEVFQHVQGRITASKIIHFHGIAAVMQILQHAGNQLHAADGRGFRDLHMQEIDRDLVALPDRLDFIGVILAVDVIPGHIDGNRYAGNLHVQTFPLEPAYYLKHMQVCTGDQIVLFQHRDKITGVLHSVLRVAPAHQRLRTNHTPGGVIHFRLIDCINMPIAHRIKETANQFLFRHFTFHLISLLS